MEINDPTTLAEVTAAFERYEQALTSNDTEVLDELFWKSGEVVRFGVAENLYGYDEIAAFRAANRTVNLEREVGKAVVTTFGTDFATTALEFGRPETFAGRQMQTWVRFDEGWRVVAAHVSRFEPDRYK